MNRIDFFIHPDKSEMKVRLRIWPSLILSLAVITRASLRDGREEEKFVVFRAAPNTMEQLNVVRELHDNMHKYDLDFWLTPAALGHNADIMIRKIQQKWLENLFTNHSIPHNITIKDVQQLILDREHKPRNTTGDFSKRLNDEGGNRARYGLGEYHSYDHIISWMEDIQRFYPDKARVVNIGMTEEGRPIKGIKIGSGVYRNDKRIVWIDGGIHAREWAAVHTVIYVIDRLIADYDTDPLVRRAVDQLNFYIFPVLNPDGYEYSRSGVSPMIRLWRKNRSAMLCKKDQWFRERCCGGVDLNRNFDWFWGEIGSSSDRCSEIYQGKSPFSEAEARAVRDMMLSPELRGKVDAFLTLHTYSQMWIHPFSHQRKTVPEDITDIEQVGKRALNALESVYGTKYRFGTGADILYPSSGGSDDWAKGKGGAKYVYLMELRPGEEVWDGFILDSRQLIPTGRETWAGIKVVIEAVLKLRRATIASTVDASSSPSPAITTIETTTTTTTTETETTTTATTPPPPPATIFTTTTTTTATMATEHWVGDWVTPTIPNAPLIFTPPTFERSQTLSTIVVPQFAITRAPVRFITLARGSASVGTIQNPQNIQWNWSETQSTTARPTRPTTTTMISPTTFPQTMNTFRRRIFNRPNLIKPIFVSSEARSIALERLRQQQANLEAMRQRARGDQRFSTIQSGSVRFNRPMSVQSATCFDRSPWCAAWMERNPQVCIVSSIFMRRDCSRTCRFC
ncbi:hypothetical protein RB195_007919 [Necator americanus]|uniref:ShTK domain protein n=1 Tax=Necator americanus TaxID=51031 RepID=A0ABR1C2R9_NECAM